MKTLKELYQLVLEELKNPQYQGICIVINKLHFNNIIQYNETILLETHFKKHKPTIFSKFWWDSSFNKSLLSHYSYWWAGNKKGKEQRIKFIEYIISKL